MCGRYSIAGNPAALGERLGVRPVVIPPRYNIAPAQEAPVIMNYPDRQMRLLRWGLIPAWAKDELTGYKMINARAETLAEKPSFRQPFERQRCLVLADGYYEWKKTGPGKVPHRFALQSGELFALAGLWESWRRPDGRDLLTFTIITTEANSLARPIHDRMPVILRDQDYESWLDPRRTRREELQLLLRPFPPDEMRCYPVSRWVNSPAHDDHQCIVPA
jgi:putative SOS response-associated peptidase YedK